MRTIVWCICAAAACICFICGFGFYGRLTDYSSLRKDISRQLNEISTLKAGQDQSVPRQSSVQSASETVNGFSSQVAGAGLSEISLISEKNALSFEGWEEWRIEAVCTGPLDNMYSFINKLETAGIYHILSFTMELNNESHYDLNIKLLFYTRHE